VSTILALSVTLMIELSLVTVIMAFAGGIEVFIFLPGLIAMMAIMIAFCVGLSLMLSIALVYFRDTQYFMALVIQLWFYATPIIYSQSLIESQQQALRASGWNLFGEPFPLLFLYNLNPATLFTGAFRTMLYDFAWPQWGVWAGSLAWALVVLAIGAAVFRKFSARMVEEL
jgi:ABC-2 type transport system permease protein